MKCPFFCIFIFLFLAHRFCLLCHAIVGVFGVAVVAAVPLTTGQRANVGREWT